MKDRLSIPCPAEKYGADLVAETMTQVYPSQGQCCTSHGCVRDTCLLEGYWPEEQAEMARESASTGKDEPSDMACCGCSSWEYLGSD